MERQNVTLPCRKYPCLGMLSIPFHLYSQHQKILRSILVRSFTGYDQCNWHQLTHTPHPPSGTTRNLFSTGPVRKTPFKHSCVYRQSSCLISVSMCFCKEEWQQTKNAILEPPKLAKSLSSIMIWQPFLGSDNHMIDPLKRKSHLSLHTALKPDRFRKHKKCLQKCPQKTKPKGKKLLFFFW